MAGILAVSFTQLHSWPRIVLLAVGSFFLLALTIAVAKHRLGADIRTIEIQDLEAKLGMKRLPLVTKDAVKVYGERLTENKIYRWIVNWNVGSEIMLMYLLLIASILLAALAAYEVAAPYIRLGL
jgi:hypothetical protein